MTTPPVEERRGFLMWLTAAVGALATVMLAVPFVAYLASPLRRKKAVWHKLGAVGDFPQGETRLVTFPNPLRQPWDGRTGNTGVYVRYLGGDDFMVLSMNCAHLGCPVSWFPQSGLFMCPCHGGVYYEDGERASGPPPRGMFHCVWELRGKDLWVQAPRFPTLQDTLTHPA
jgi:menaquinol-cytochrome c reductase iron-sulfur subunit